jgi:type II secretory pathway pseudopilin PulG
VIIILGILAVTAAPRFLSFSVDANAALVKSIASSFKTGVRMAHSKWQLQGGTGPIDNLDIYGNGQATLDINANGWPAQYWPPVETSPVLDHVNDCISLWQTLLDDSASSVAENIYTEFQAVYSSNTCTFIMVAQPEFSIFYGSNSGVVTADTEL